MEVKLFLICLLELIGAALVVTPLILAIAKAIFTLRVQALERMIGDIFIAIGKLGTRGKNKDKSEKD